MAVSWVLIAFLYPALFAASNVFDKFLIEKRISNCFSLALIIGWLELISALIVLFFVPFNGLTIKLTSLGVLSGIIYGAAYFLYYYSISLEEVSRVISVYYITPIIVMVLARVFLAESLPVWKYAGAIVAVIGAVLIGLRKIELKLNFRKAFWLSLLTCFVWATVNIIQKYLLEHLSFWNVFTLQSFGLSAMLTTALFSSSVRSHLKHIVHNLHIIWIPEVLNVTAIVIYLSAVAKTEVSKISPMGSLQPLYLLIFMLLMSKYVPNLLREEFTRKTLIIKIVAVIMIVTGALLVAL